MPRTVSLAHSQALPASHSTCSFGLCTPHPVFLSVKFTTHNQIYIDFLLYCLLTAVKKSIITVSGGLVDWLPPTPPAAPTHILVLIDFTLKIYSNLIHFPTIDGGAGLRSDGVAGVAASNLDALLYLTQREPNCLIPAEPVMFQAGCS